MNDPALDLLKEKFRNSEERIEEARRNMEQLKFDMEGLTKSYEWHKEELKKAQWERDSYENTIREIENIRYERFR
jgi:chromosome segregation ATPase